MNQIAQDYREVAEKAVECLENGFIDAMTNLAFPEEVRKYIRTSNHLERLNKELKRRSTVIGIFPNEASLIRLMGSVLINEHDKWSAKRRYYYKPTYDKVIEKSLVFKLMAEEQHQFLIAA